MARQWEEEVVLQGDGSLHDQVGELRLRIRELPMADGVHASTGCQLWTASILLAHLLLERQPLVQGRRVLEVGAGCGLVGITAARLAGCTLITDGDEEVVENIAHNVCANEPAWKAGPGEPPREVIVRRLRWEEELGRPWPEHERADVILASDIIYGHWGDTVAKALVNMLRRDGTILLVTSEDRRSGVQAFKEHLQHAGFRVAETKLSSQLGDFRTLECRELLPWERSTSGNSEPAAVRVAAAPFGLRAAREKAPPPGAQLAAASCSRPPLVQAPSPAPATAAAEDPARPLWRVVGGLVQGRGIIVRGGTDGKLSAYLGRLEHGAIIVEVEQTEDRRRLRYSKVAGAGPGEGWVSLLSGKGARLLAPVAPSSL